MSQEMIKICLLRRRGLRDSTVRTFTVYMMGYIDNQSQLAIVQHLSAAMATKVEYRWVRMVDLKVPEFWRSSTISGWYEDVEAHADRAPPRFRRFPQVLNVGG